jgi:hypothetical protein
MPWSRFRALLGAIPALQAEDDLRSLTVAGVGANPGDKGQTFREVSNELRKVAGGGAGGAPTHGRDTIMPGLTPGVTEMEDADGVLAELRAKRAAWFEEHARRQAANRKT